MDLFKNNSPLASGELITAPDYAQTAPDPTITKTLLRIFSSLVLVIFSCGLLLIQMLTPYFYPKQFGSFDLHYANSFLFFIAFTWFWSVAIPIVANKFVLKEKLANLGLRLPANNLIALLFTLLALIILAPIMYHLSLTPSFRAYYFLGNPTVSRIIFVDVLMMPLYYFAEEFFFRGFLFLGLWRRLGWHSFWITDIIFTIAHANKPPMEILLSIPGSVIFNFITLKTKSIYPAMIVHTTLGVLLNLSVAFAMMK